MQKTTVIFSLFILFAACTAVESTQVEEVQVQETEQVEQDSVAIENDKIQAEEGVGEPIATEIPPPTEILETLPPLLETVGPDCIGSEPHEIGLGITESFPETSYEQVMTWFCNGAEFEDILVALQTEKLTDFPAGEMLFMLADDWTWEEIWQVIGLTEE
jgi:hypothetical protein